MIIPAGVNLRKRGASWQVDIGARVTGTNRIQKSYRTKAQATAGLAKSLRDLRSHGADILDVSSDEWRAWTEATRVLKEKGFRPTQITDAVSFFVEHNDPTTTRKTVKEIYDEFMESKQQAGVSTLTIKGYQWKIGRFAKDFAREVLNDVTTAEIEAWFNKKELKGRNRADYRRHLCIFWGFAVSRNYVHRNVAAAVSKVKVPPRVPEILTPQEVRLLLFAAKDLNLGRMLPYFAIGCFCGLRPWELRRTAWADVNVTTKEIYVTPEACKTAQDRYVSMPDNLLEWLHFVPESSRVGTLHYTRNDFDAVRKKAGLTSKWAGDIMRHSAASHLYAKTQNAPLVTAQMGHGLGVFMKHYKRSVSLREGELYFAVKPTDPVENVVKLEATA